MPSNKVEVALVSDKDIPTCFQVLSESFGHDAPFVDIYFPGHDTPSGQAQGTKRLTAWKQSSEDSTFLKAVARAGEGHQEHIVGLAVWTYMKEPPPAELEKVEDVEEVWPDEEDREFMTRLWRDYVIPRTRVINESSNKGVYGKRKQFGLKEMQISYNLNLEYSSRIARGSSRLPAFRCWHSSCQVGD